MPRLVAFSDPHIGRVWVSHTTPSTRPALTSRYLDPVKEVISKYQGKAPIVCGGDFFDHAHNPESVVKDGAALLEHITCTIAGNHDHAGRESAFTSLQLIEQLQGVGAKHTIIAPDHLNAPHADLRVFEEEGATPLFLYTVPHHATQALFEQAVMEAHGHAVTVTEGFKVLVIHCNRGSIGGGKPDSSLYFTPQLEAVVGKAFTYILIGHEHLSVQQGNVIVMGSTQPCNFGELGPRFFYEFHEEFGTLQMKKVPISAAMRSASMDLGSTSDWSVKPQAELFHLKGKLPIAQAKAVQKLVKDLYTQGALAVKVEVEFEKAGATGPDVSGSMNNLVDVVRSEIAKNKAWVDLFEEALTAVSSGEA